MKNRVPSLAIPGLPADDRTASTLSRSADMAMRTMPEADAIRDAALAAYGMEDDAASAAVAAALANEVSASLDAARCDVLEASRRLLHAHRQQHATRLAANEAETEWTVACFSSGSSREEVRRTNRIRARVAAHPRVGVARLSGRRPAALPRDRVDGGTGGAGGVVDTDHARFRTGSP